MGYEIEFYKTEIGRDPVSDFIKTLDKKHAAKIYQNIGMLRDFGAEPSFPICGFHKGRQIQGADGISHDTGEKYFQDILFRYRERQ